MKKTLKSLTAFLLLLALFSNIQPMQSPVGNDKEPEISLCTDDDDFEFVIGKY